MRASALLGPDGPLASALPHYEHRASQLAMADMVEEALTHKGVAVIEAGTGTGKTLAYLVPAILSGQKVVISTGTRALQDQIMDHDLPFLAEHLGVEVNAACMKGLSNYLCRRRYRALLEGPESERPSIARHLPIVMSWVEGSETGDRAELEDLAEDSPIWGAIQSGTDTRIGARCSHHNECFVTAMRRRAEDAQILVVNHHLFFADLAVRGTGGAVIPAYDAVVFDEAHQIEDVATMFFGHQVSDQRILKLAKDIERAFAHAPADARLLDTLASRTEEFFAHVAERVGGLADGRAQLPSGLFGAHYHALDTAMEALVLVLERKVHESETFGQLFRRTRRLRDELGRIADGAGRSHVGWAEATDRRCAVGASPVDVSQIVQSEVIHRIPTVILTSATLTTGGSFSYIKRRLGIDFEIDEAVLESPFDHERQAALYLPSLPDPRSPAYSDAATAEIVRLIELTRGGAFVLCTSVRMMHRFADGCRRLIRGHPIYVQGEAPKRALLSRFREEGDAILFATRSFWEGVDVPGSALRLVIVDKLPFDVPSDPLVRARCEALEAEGEAAFIRYLVPSAALTLKQGFGRLIRTRNDHGIIAVLDSRLTTKGYGKVFLKSLPPVSRCTSFEALRQTYRAQRPGP